MAQVNVRITEDLREQVKQVASQQHPRTSRDFQLFLNQFCATAIARAVGEAQARRFFTQPARELSAEEGRREFSEVLGKVKK